MTRHSRAHIREQRERHVKRAERALAPWRDVLEDRLEKTVRIVAKTRGRGPLRADADWERTEQERRVALLRDADAADTEAIDAT